MMQAATTLIGFLILSATIAYLGRYETAVTTDGRAVVTDRWRGTVEVCTGLHGGIIICYPTFPATPRTLDQILGSPPTAPKPQQPSTSN